MGNRGRWLRIVENSSYSGENMKIFGNIWEEWRILIIVENIIGNNRRKQQDMIQNNLIHWGICICWPRVHQGVANDRTVPSYFAPLNTLVVEWCESRLRETWSRQTRNIWHYLGHPALSRNDWRYLGTFGVISEHSALSRTFGVISECLALSRNVWRYLLELISHL